MRIGDDGEHTPGHNGCGEGHWKHHAALNMQVTVYEAWDGKKPTAIEDPATVRPRIVGLEDPSHNSVAHGDVRWVRFARESVDQSDICNHEIR
jgi:hypothetical protein